MLIKKAEAEKIIADCRLVKTSKTNACFRKEFVDVRPVNNGFVVVENGIARHYVNEKNVVSSHILHGEFSVRDAAMTSLNCREYRFFDVPVTPIWQLQLDTITGEYVFKRVDDYKAISLSGKTLTLCFFGGKTEKEIKAKIHRKLKEMIRKGDVEIED